MKPPREPACSLPETFPAEITNRAALERIAYRIGGYADARQFLLRRLDEDPVLSAWTYRGADDPGIALYEGAAILVDLLTLYGEAYANEAFLRTATWRESVADLVRLTGYRLKPGIGGVGTFALVVDGDGPVTVPSGTGITADLAGVPDTANFQTSEAITALPWLSKLTLEHPQLQPSIANGDRHLLVSQPGRTFQPHDRLLIGVPIGPAGAPTGLSTWEIVVVESVELWHGRTLVTLEGAISQVGGATSLVAFQLGSTFHHFGHDAPRQRVEVDASGVGIGIEVSTARDFGRTSAGGDGAAASPALRPDELALDPQVMDLALGTRLAIQASRLQSDFDPEATSAQNALNRFSLNYVRSLTLRTVTSIRQVTGRYGALTAPTTIASVSSALALGKLSLTAILIDTVRGDGMVVGAPWKSTPASSGSTLDWWGSASHAQALRGRTLAVVPVAGTPFTIAVSDVVATAQPDRFTLLLAAPVDYAMFAGGTTFGNLVRATEGKPEPEAVLGNGDEQQTFQTFKIPRDPLTYLGRAALTPPERPELVIVVNGRIWTFVPTLYGQSPDAEVYVVRQDHGGNSWVQFGDGKTGGRLPSGVGNVRARFRSGAGSFGPIKPGAEPSLVQRIDVVDSVALPSAVEGGTAPEGPDVARTAAPLRVQSLDRLVSLADFEAEALGLGGVERARAAWGIVDGLPAIQVTILVQPRRLADVPHIEASLATANRMRGTNRYPLHVVTGAFEYVFLDVTATIDPTYDAIPVRVAVESALDAVFAHRDFARAEYATRLEGIVQNVAGVRHAVVNALGSLGLADDPAALVYPPSPLRAEVVACASTRSLALARACLVVRIETGGAP